jgi:hypothetical protein
VDLTLKTIRATNTYFLSHMNRKFSFKKNIWLVRMVPVAGGSTRPLGATARPGRCGNCSGRRGWRLVWAGATVLPALPPAAGADERQ